MIFSYVSGAYISLINFTVKLIIYIDYRDETICFSEADPLVGWSKDEAWRADSTYAAIVAKVTFL